MAIKAADTLEPNGDFALAEAKDVSVETSSTSYDDDGNEITSVITQDLQTALDKGLWDTSRFMVYPTTLTGYFYSVENDGYIFYASEKNDFTLDGSYIPTVIRKYDGAVHVAGVTGGYFFMQESSVDGMLYWKEDVEEYRIPKENSPDSDYIDKDTAGCILWCGGDGFAEMGCSVYDQSYIQQIVSNSDPYAYSYTGNMIWSQIAQSKFAVFDNGYGVQIAFDTGYLQWKGVLEKGLSIQFYRVQEKTESGAVFYWTQWSPFTSYEWPTLKASSSGDGVFYISSEEDSALFRFSNDITPFDFQFDESDRLVYYLARSYKYENKKIYDIIHGFPNSLRADINDTKKKLASITDSLSIYLPSAYAGYYDCYTNDAGTSVFMAKGTLFKTGKVVSFYSDASGNVYWPPVNCTTDLTLVTSSTGDDVVYIKGLSDEAAYQFSTSLTSTSKTVNDGDEVRLYDGKLTFVEKDYKNWPQTKAVKYKSWDQPTDAEVKTTDEHTYIVNGYGLFKGCENMTSFTQTDYQKHLTGITCADEMFSGCTELTSVNCLIGSATADNTLRLPCLTSAKKMFMSCKNLTEVKFKGDASILHLDWMFSGCKNLTSQQVLVKDAVDTPMQALSTRLMFDRCFSLDGDVSDGYQYTKDAYGMYANCVGLTSYVFENNGFRDAYNMDYFFSVGAVGGVYSGEEASKYRADSFEVLFETPVNPMTAKGMFYSKGNMPTLEISEGCFERTIDASAMFQQTKALATLSLGKNVFANVEDGSYMFCDTGLSDVAFPSGTFEHLKSASHMFFSSGESAYPAAIKNVTFTSSLPNLTNAQYMFANQEYLETVSGIGFENIVDMHFMFTYAGQMGMNFNLELPEGGLQKVENISEAFAYASGPFFDNVVFPKDALCVATNLGGLFEETDLVAVTFTSGTPKAENLNKIFFECEVLTSVTGLTCSEATDMGYAFYLCKKITSITLEGGTAKVKNFAYAFLACSELTTISGLDLTSATNITMIWGTNDLPKLTSCVLSGTLYISGVYLKYLPALDEESLKSWVSALYDWTTNPESKTSTSTDHILYMSSAQQTTVGDEMLAAAVEKGWTIE